MLTRLPCTMDTSPPQSWTTTELRKFLKERAIPYSGYSKAVLVGMVEKAIANPGITEITQPSDVVVAGITRKTVSVNGNVILFPDPRVITSWEKDLTSLPHLTSAKCLVYLLSKGGWSSERAISYEKERGYQLFMESHIDEVELNQEDHNMTYVWALCRRQTAQSEKPYQVWLLLNTTGTIETAGCQCIGDDGSCKHVVALMFAIEDFVSRRGDHASAPTCTDLPCMWNKPRRNTKQIKAVDLDHSGQPSTISVVRPRFGYNNFFQNVVFSELSHYMSSLCHVVKQNGLFYLFFFNPMCIPLPLPRKNYVEKCILVRICILMYIE
ncbi:uncharacterized protein LOC135100387 isoform X2 [Scylla paramamosain]|uniref:uncharacterized protein LOC135100387 isoform X2 n=1 Tax=Scylla paramamosain TaxID=85552 RepID=UPI00308355A7